MAAGSKEEEDSGLCNHTPWREHDWNAVLAGVGTADRYFARAGLVRKDRLAALAPPDHHPPTVVLRSFEELGPAFEKLGLQAATAESEERAVRYVLKRAHSSNASGIRFLSAADARAVLDAAGGGRAAVDALAGCPPATSELRAPLLAFCGVAVAAGCLCRPSGRQNRPLLPAAALAAALGLAGLAAWGRAGGRATAADAAASPERDAVVDDLRDILQPAAADGQEKAEVWVLQRYIEPWLHEGRKFHLRVLLLCVGDLQAYVHEDVRVLIATEAFGLGEADGSRLFAHVTNMGAGRRSPEYREAAQNLPLAALGEETARRISGEVTRVLGATLVRVRAAGRRHFFTTPNCWELFGVDFLVEAGSGRAVLLEINPSPSMAMYGSGSDVRARLCGPDPLEAVLPSWRRVPMDA